MNVLISLHRGYGLGDCCQMSAVLRHVTKYRPHWKVDYQAEAGRYCAGNGVVNGTTFEYGKNPDPDKRYGADVEICLYDTWANWGDRPNTRVSSCLHERFGLGWDAECGRYQVGISDVDKRCAKILLPQDNLVALHYIGDSSQDKKNLTHSQANRICQEVDRLVYIPVILDWRRNCVLYDWRRVTSPTDWGNNIEMVCAVISRCRAFVGIDSGPSKGAAATDTPALVVWTGHHPAPFHDPAPNTTHLVPVGYHGLEPVCGDAGVIEWFEENYNVRLYRDDPVREVCDWLGETLTS